MAVSSTSDLTTALEDLTYGTTERKVNQRGSSELGKDDELLSELEKDHDVVITLEDGILEGGFGEKIARFYEAMPFSPAMR